MGITRTVGRPLQWHRLITNEGESFVNIDHVVSMTVRKAGSRWFLDVWVVGIDDPYKVEFPTKAQAEQFRLDMLVRSGFVLPP